VALSYIAGDNAGCQCKRPILTAVMNILVHKSDGSVPIKSTTETSPLDRSYRIFAIPMVRMHSVNGFFPSTAAFKVDNDQAELET